MIELHRPRIPESTWIEVLRIQALFEKVSDRLGVERLNLKFGQPSLNNENEMLRQFLHERSAFLYEKTGFSNRSDLLIEREALESSEKERIQSALLYYEHIDSIHSRSGEFELWQGRTLAPDNLFPVLQVLPIDTRTSIHSENHGMGYHIHYLFRGVRTNVILLFDRKEPPEEMSPKLYWEPHSEGSTIPARPSPDKFGEDRAQRVYTTCQSLLRKYPKTEFRRLSKKSKLLYPIN